MRPSYLYTDPYTGRWVLAITTSWYLSVYHSIDRPGQWDAVLYKKNRHKTKRILGRARNINTAEGYDAVCQLMMIRDVEGEERQRRQTESHVRKLELER